MCTNTGVPWQHGDRRKPRCWNSSEGWRRIWCEVFFLLLLLLSHGSWLSPWDYSLFLSLRRWFGGSQLLSELWWLRSCVVSVCCMSVCVLIRSRCLITLIMKKRKEYVISISRKPCGCSNDNVCYSRRYVIIGARTPRGDFCDRGASARKSPPMESRRWWWWWLCWNRLAGKMMKLGESAMPGWWWEGGGAQKQQHGWTKGM